MVGSLTRRTNGSQSIPSVIGMASADIEPEQSHQCVEAEVGVGCLDRDRDLVVDRAR